MSQDDTPIGELLEAARELYQSGRPVEAIAAAKRALLADPRSVGATMLLARITADAGRADVAVPLLSRAVTLGRTDSGLLREAAQLFERLGRADLAADALLHAEAATAGGDADLLRTRAQELLSAGRRAEAVEHLERLAALAPRDITVRHTLAQLAVADQRHESAVHHLRAAVAVREDLPELWLNLGQVLAAIGDAEGARECFQRTRALAPSSVPARWLHARAVPVVAASEEERARELRRAEAELQQLARWLDTSDPAARKDASRGIPDNFHVHYLGEPLIELQRAYGGLVHRVVGDTARRPRTDRRPPRIRVGFASSCFRDHTVLKLFVGWMRELDRSRFEVRGYHVGPGADEGTEMARAACEQFAHVPWPDAVDAIGADDLDALVYPEVGMDSNVVKLAAHRLAPVQAVAWGHPITTGLPTMDYFLTSDLMEPPGAEARYTEQVVRLPNLSLYVEPLDPGAPTVPRSALRAPDDATLYVCCQSLFKIPPAQDRLLARIARNVGNARFVFLQHHARPVTDLFKRRLSEAFAAEGLDAAGHSIWLPRLSFRSYLDLNLLGDVFLDTLEWSGGQTALEAVACSLVPVTLPGATMRSRHTAAILRRMGVTDTIAGSADEYVEIATRLGLDADRRRDVRARIIASRDALYRDRESIRALEAFLEGAVEQAH